MEEPRWPRIWPAVLWVFVFTGSELILNGAHGNRDAWQAAVGLALVSLAFVVGVYLAVHRWPNGRPEIVTWSLGAVALFYVVCAVAAWLFGGVAYGAAALVAGLIPITAVALVLASAKDSTGLDDATPVGATPEAHDDVSLHDLPRDHPARRALQR
jgi:peptidoglycan/LPS O-acetylase OafA/YrhL